MLAAAFLLTLGASDDAVVADYAVTGRNSAAIGQRLRPVLAAILAEHGIRNVMTAAAGQQQFSGLAMETMLATLRRRHGDPLQPLREAGLSDRLVETLRGRAVVDAAD